MSILIDQDTTFIIQGITGREAVNLTRECLDYGSKIVGGVTPGRKGREVHGVPVFDTVEQVVEHNGGVVPDGSVVTVPPAGTRDAVFEALHAGIKTIVIVTERIPRRDVAMMVELADAKGARITFDQVVLPLLENEAIGAEGHMFLNYAMAKFYEQAGDYGSAMQQYDRANAHAYRLYNSRYENDPQAVEEEIATLAQLYSREKIEALRQFGSASQVPLFVVGMIRTGTTLFDQILSSHRDVKSAGEQPFWQVSAGRVNRRWLESGGAPADVKELEARYLQVLQTPAGDAKRVKSR